MPSVISDTEAMKPGVARVTSTPSRLRGLDVDVADIDATRRNAPAIRREQGRTRRPRRPGGPTRLIAQP
jgi:hypothetical protein